MQPSRNHAINCGLATSSFSRTFAKRRVADRSFDVSAQAVQRVISAASVSQVAERDVSITRSVSASAVTDFFVSTQFRFPGYAKAISVKSSNAAVVSNPAEDGRAAFAGVGAASFIATASDGESAVVAVSSQSPGSIAVNTPSGWVAGSLADHCTSQVNSRLSGQLNAFSQQDGTNFIRNPACWLAGVDITCASPWNSTGGLRRAGTLISPRHVLFCEHYDFHPTAGATIKFVSLDNQVVTRTIASLAAHPQYSAFFPDITVGVLDQDVPASISFARVLPDNWNSYLPSLSAVATTPVVRFNQSERVTVAGLAALSSMFSLNRVNVNPAYYEDIVTGDSGNPVFLLVNDKPVLIGTFTYGGAGSGTFVTPQRAAIDAMMASLGGGYSLTSVDLSAFPSYSV